MARGGYRYDRRDGGVLTKEEERAILEAYEALPFIKEVARRMGHGIHTVRKVLKAANVIGGVSPEECGL